MVPAAPSEDADAGRVRFTPASREGEAGAAEAPTREAQSGDAPPQYEEVTLTDLVVTIIDHWVPAVVVLLLVVGGTAAYTFTQPAMYSASATFIPVNAEDAILDVMGSRMFAADVAERVGLVQELGGGDAERAGAVLQSRVDVGSGVGAVPRGGSGSVVTVTATMGNPVDAALVANGYVDTLDDWRGALENVTWGRNWETYYEDAGKNETLARQQLTDLVEGMVYVQELDTAKPPDAASSPNVELNMALGATLGLMLAFMTPFVIEAAGNVRRELRER